MRFLLASAALLLFTIAALGLASGAFFAGYHWQELAASCSGSAGGDDEESPAIQNAEVSASLPYSVEPGENFVLSLKVKNTGIGPLTITGVNLYASYLDGFAIIQSPSKVSYDHSSQHCRVFTLDLTIPAGEERAIPFLLRAEFEGIYRGDALVYTEYGSNVLMLQTVATFESETRSAGL